MELTANNESQWFSFAVIAAMGLHLILVSPLSNWMDRSFLPVLGEHEIQIELTDTPLEPIPPVEEEPPPIDTEPDHIFTNLPKHKKTLRPDLQEDEILVPHDGPPKEATVKPGQKPDEPDWDLLDKVIDEPLFPLEVVNPQQIPKEPIPPVDPQQSPSVPEDGTISVVKQEISPLFRKPVETEKPIDATPPSIKETFRGPIPEKTERDQIQFSLNNYQWTYQRYMENWAIDLSKWWEAPAEYIGGKVPNGGHVWVRVRLSRQGGLLGYKVFNSELTPQMELAVIKALIGSLERPALPESFPEDLLIINWKFIYPALLPAVRMKQR